MDRVEGDVEGEEAGWRRGNICGSTGQLTISQSHDATAMASP